MNVFSNVKLLFATIVFLSVWTIRLADLSLSNFQHSFPYLLPSVDTCYGKGPLIRILSDAGLNHSDCSGLSSWKDITYLYGSEPVLVGLETCAAYRENVGNGTNGGPVPRIAGMYNTGTNAIAKLLELNWRSARDRLKYMDDQSYFKWDVPYGKHVPLHKRNNVTVPPENATPKDKVLPIVIIKDPYWWMQSMCNNAYGAKWPHKTAHCPNLIATESDQKMSHAVQLDSAIPVTVKYTFGRSQKNIDQSFETNHTSLAHLWSDYYREYFESTDPRLIVRYEDILYHAPFVLQSISECIGLDMADFQYVIGRSKGLGSGGTDFRRALAKYSDPQLRLRNLTRHDKAFAREAIDDQIMRVFNYRVV